MRPMITAYDWVPDFTKSQVRGPRLRCALEEVGQLYDMLYLQQGEQKRPPQRDRQPFGQVPTYEAGDLTMVAVFCSLGGTPLLDVHPTLTEYVARGEARPAFARALADQSAGFTGAPPPTFAA